MAAQIEMSARDMPVRWSFPARLGFRFIVVYVPLFFISMTPLPPTTWAVRRIGTHLLHVTAAMSGMRGVSNDTVYDYVRVLCCLVLAAVAALAWSALDARRPNYRALYAWLRWFVRLILVLAMSLYGWDKVLDMQMPPPRFEAMITPLGQLSRFTLLWTFMGASVPYEMFCGAAELLAGALLLFRRSTTLGALICMGVMTNVFLMNMNYDVPVKVLSFHLLLLSGFLVASDGRRLAAVFLLNRPAPPVTYAPLSTRPWVNRSAAAFIGLFAIIGFGLTVSLYALAVRPAARARSAWALRPLAGAWTVDDFVDGVGPSRFAGHTRWQKLVFLNDHAGEIQLGDDSLDGIDVKIDETRKTLILSDQSNTTLPSLPKVWTSQFTYQLVAADKLTLDGTLEGRSLHATLHWIDPATFPLTATPFHWTSDAR